MTTTAPSIKLFVGGLNTNVDEQQLEHAFARFGEVSHTSIVTGPPRGASRGFGFVEFVEVTAADAAVAQLNGSQLAGRRLRVSRVDRRNTEEDDLSGWQERRFRRRGRRKKDDVG